MTSQKCSAAAVASSNSTAPRKQPDLPSPPVRWPSWRRDPPATVKAVCRQRLRTARKGRGPDSSLQYGNTSRTFPCFRRGMKLLLLLQFGGETVIGGGGSTPAVSPPEPWRRPARVVHRRDAIRRALQCAPAAQIDGANSQLSAGASSTRPKRWPSPAMSSGTNKRSRPQPTAKPLRRRRQTALHARFLRNSFATTFAARSPRPDSGYWLSASSRARFSRRERAGHNRRPREVLRAARLNNRLGASRSSLARPVRRWWPKAETRSSSRRLGIAAATRRLVAKVWRRTRRGRGPFRKLADRATFGVSASIKIRRTATSAAANASADG